MKKLIITALTLAVMGMIHAQSIERVEPLCWWSGMKTPLQLMIQGKNLKGSEVKSLDRGMTVKKVHNADSPNYLFVDLFIDDNAEEGTYRLEISKNGKKITHKYQIFKRKEDSAERGSFSSADMVYLLMPDRFANGNPNNDNTTNTIEKVNMQNPNGRHGGDIQGILDHLDYINELGATAIWSTPLTLDNQPTFSYHGYACCDYYNIDPRFGSNALYRELVQKAHQREMKIIFDAVPNHCGTNHWWMKDLPFRNWINSSANYKQTNGQFITNSDPHAARIDINNCVDGWFDTSMPDLNTNNPFLLQYLKQMVVWWIEWADLDGVRVDTYPYNEKYMIANWTRAIVNEYPNMNLVGECWVGNPAFVSYWEGANRNKDGYKSNLPSVMDFPLQEAIIEGIKNDSLRWGQNLHKIYSVLAQDFVYARPNTMFIFGDNHDIDRLAYLLGKDPRKIKMAITLIATMRGVPQIYYGTELMFVGDPKEGHGGERMDFPGGWIGDKLNLFNPKDRSKIQNDVFNHTKAIFNKRKKITPLHEGKMMHYLPQDNMYVYFRYTDNECVMVILNGSDKQRKISWPHYAQMVSKYNTGNNILTGKNVSVGSELAVEAMSSTVIHFAQ